MALIVFAARTQLSDDHTPVVADNGAIIYIRAIPFNGTADQALDCALTYELPGEKMLSAVDLQNLG